MHKQERRVRRSPYTGSALSLQLQACAERSGVEAMILASRDGFVVASSPWNEDSTEHIAAQVAEVSSHQFRVDTVREVGAPVRTIAARGFDVGEEQLIVCAVGCPTETTVDEMYRAIDGVQRILAA